MQRRWNTIESLMSGFYESLTVPAEEHADFDNMKRLFYPHARLKPPSRESGPRRSLTFDEFAVIYGDHFERYYREGVTHEQLQCRVSRLGDIAHVWSGYEFRSGSGSLARRGIISFQLVFESERWYITALAWEHASAGELAAQFPG